MREQNRTLKSSFALFFRYENNILYNSHIVYPHYTHTQRLLTGEYHLTGG